MNDQQRAEEEALQLRWENLLLRLNAVNDIYTLDGNNIKAKQGNASVRIHRQQVFTGGWSTRKNYAIRIEAKENDSYNGKLEYLHANKLRKDFSEIDNKAFDKKVKKILDDAEKVLKTEKDNKAVKESNIKFINDNFKDAKIETYSRYATRVTFEYRGYDLYTWDAPKVGFCSNDGYSYNPKYLGSKEGTVEQIKEIIDTLIEQKTEILNILGEES